MTGNPKEAENLGYYLHRAFSALTDELTRQLHTGGLNISHAHFSILQAISREPGINQNELARCLGKDIAAISRSLCYLEKRGLIRREWLNGCTKGVYLTKSGEEQRPLLDQAIRSSIERACKKSDGAEIEICINALKNIYSSLKDDY